MSQEIKHSNETDREHVVVAPDSIQRTPASDELSLLDLWSILFSKRSLIIGTVAVSLIISMAVAFLTTPVYQASIHFQPPLTKDVAALNIPKLGMNYTPDTVYQEFQRNFVSRILLWDFFIAHRLYEAYLDGDGPDDMDIDMAFEKYFLGSLKFVQRDTENFFRNATLNWNEPLQGASVLNAYSEYVQEITLKQFIEEINSKISMKKAEAQAKIDSLRGAARIKNNYRLAVLDENINIAKELGIKRQKGLSNEIVSDVFVEVTEKQPLYFQGYEVLEVEKRALQARKNNDPFTPGLSGALQQLKDLNLIKISADQARIVKVSQQAKASLQPLGPGMKLIAIVGIVLGLFLGTFIAFISHAISGRHIS